MKNIKTFPVYSKKFWESYLIQMRPYLFFISGIAGLSGISMSTDTSTSLIRIIAAFIPFFLGYGFGQALTDCFQTDTDKLSAPYRPLSQEIISVKSVLTVSIAGLVISGSILFILKPLSFILCILSIFGLATYSYIKKNYWFAGPFYNAWIVCLLPLMGYFITSQTVSFKIPATIYMYLGLTFFSYASFVLIGYLKDIEADSKTGYKTFPVIFGWNKTIFVGDLFGIITIFLFFFNGNNNLAEVIFGIIGSLVLVIGQILGHLSKNKDEKDALIPILSTVRSFILFHCAIILHHQPHWWSIMIIFYLLFEIVLFNRPSKFQV